MTMEAMSAMTAPFLEPWSQGLLVDMQNPQMVLADFDVCVIMPDKYPKAMYHYLTLPKKNIPDLGCLSMKDLPLLRRMRRVSQDFINKHHPDIEFRLGYHVAPSMSQLHMHVISQDLLGSGMKKTRHWNAFTTEYFLPAERLESMLERHGSVERLSERRKAELLFCDLQCHKCRYKPYSLPELKQHLVKHLTYDYSAGGYLSYI